MVAGARKCARCSRQPASRHMAISRQKRDIRRNHVDRVPFLKFDGSKGYAKAAIIPLAGAQPAELFNKLEVYRTPFSAEESRVSVAHLVRCDKPGGGRADCLHWPVVLSAADLGGSTVGVGVAATFRAAGAEAWPFPSGQRPGARGRRRGVGND